MLKFFQNPAKINRSAQLPGLDGRKMSKSYDRVIYLSDSAADVTSKAQTMMTDPRQRRSDPGNPDICPVFDLHVSIVRQRSVRKWLMVVRPALAA